MKINNHRIYTQALHPHPYHTPQVVTEGRKGTTYLNHYLEVAQRKEIVTCYMTSTLVEIDLREVGKAVELDRYILVNYLKRLVHSNIKNLYDLNVYLLNIKLEKLRMQGQGKEGEVQVNRYDKTNNFEMGIRNVIQVLNIGELNRDSDIDLCTPYGR